MKDKGRKWRIIQARKERGQIALEFLMVVTMFYLILGWPMNYYLSLASSSAPEEKQLEGIARGLGILANRLCVSSYDSAVNLTYGMPCFYRSSNSTSYSIAAGGNAVNVSAANTTVVKNTLCQVNAALNASCDSPVCISSRNSNVSITSGGC